MIDYRLAAFLFFLAALAYGLITVAAILSGAFGIAAAFGVPALGFAYGSRYLDKKDRS